MTRQKPRKRRPQRRTSVRLQKDTKQSLAIRNTKKKKSLLIVSIHVITKKKERPFEEIQYPRTASKGYPFRHKFSKMFAYPTRKKMVDQMVIVHQKIASLPGSVEEYQCVGAVPSWRRRCR